ncbi:MFS transporter [Mycobacterium sp. NPDC003449]
MPPSTTGPWRLGGVLIGLTSIAPVLQYVVPALMPHYVDNLGLTRTQVGSYTTALFLVSACLSPVLGRATDKWRASTLAIYVYALAGAAAAVLAATRSYPALLVGGAVAGMSMALMQPVSNLLLLDYAHARTRGFLVAVKHTGVKLGQAVSGLVLAPLAVVWGATSALLIPVGLAALGAIGTRRTLPVSTMPASGATARHAPRQPVPAGLWWVTTYAALMGCTQSAVGAYIALFGFEEVGLSRSAAGVLAGMLGVVGFLARMGWGGFAFRSGRFSGALLYIATAGVPASVCMILSARFGLPALLLATLIFGVTTALWNMAITFAILAMVPRSVTGRATGRVFVGFSVGMMLGPLLFGQIVDRTGSYVAAWASLLVWQIIAVATAAPLRGIEPRKDE